MKSELANVKKKSTPKEVVVKAEQTNLATNIANEPVVDKVTNVFSFFIL
ncbi:hypothetical protein [Clostridium tarantellae]|nr:hypothetical protein [Clostridium tarantellae]